MVETVAPGRGEAGPAQGIVGPKATTSSEVYSYILNINRIFI